MVALYNTQVMCPSPWMKLHLIRSSSARYDYLHTYIPITPAVLMTSIAEYASGVLLWCISRLLRLIFIEKTVTFYFERKKTLATFFSKLRISLATFDLF